MRKGIQLIVGAAAALAVGAFSAEKARADFSYGYGEQTVNSITLTGPGVVSQNSNGSVTSTSAAVDGNGIAKNGPTDALEAYLGAAPPAPQNDFTKYSTAGGGPQAQVFTRGDVVVTGNANLFTSGVTASAVAESFTGPAAGLQTGSSNWHIAGQFTAPSTSSVTVSYGYANDILVEKSGTAANPANAQFGVVISIKDQHGHELDATPSELNTAVSSPPNGPEVITSGTSNVTLSLAGLTAGDLYSVSINGQAFSSASVVPEPASVGLLAAGAGLLLVRRRRAL